MQISLKVGDKLRALTHAPYWADIEKGEIVTVTGFGVQDAFANPDGFDGVAPRLNGRWYVNVKDLFKNYEKVGK